jgi:hypothetical protein
MARVGVKRPRRTGPDSVVSANTRVVGLGVVVTLLDSAPLAEHCSTMSKRVRVKDILLLHKQYRSKV